MFRVTLTGRQERNRRFVLLISLFEKENTRGAFMRFPGIFAAKASAAREFRASAGRALVNGSR
jgi:hypothetical protein